MEHSLKSLRKMSKIRQEDAAKLVDVSRQTMIIWEKDVERIPTDKLVKLLTTYAENL